MTEDRVDRGASPEDNEFMAEAIRVAARIPGRPWPNPPVGALVVNDGRVVGRGAHHGAGSPHAEVLALADAGPRAAGATLYCTLEPCNHHGRTPPCAPQVAASGVRRVVIGASDPNPKVCGGGAEVLRAAGIDVAMRVRGDDALDLIWPFAATSAFERPFVLLKTATSLDGRFARPRVGPGDGPAYLTGLDARRDVHRLRRWCDVVLVGEGTMRADRPQLDGRLAGEGDECPATDPLPAYADTDLSCDGGWPRRPYWVFAGRASARPDRQRATERQHGTVVLCDEREGHVAPDALVAEFARRGGHCLMIEGGPTLAAAFLASGVVDRWISYVAPVVLGSGVSWPNPAASDRAGSSIASPGDSPFHVTRVERIGCDTKTVLDRIRFADPLVRLTAGEGGGH